MMKHFRKVDNCMNCLYCHRYDEAEIRTVSERLYQEYYTYFCSMATVNDIESPALTVCDDWESEE